VTYLVFLSYLSALNALLLEWISQYALSTSFYHFRQCGVVPKPRSGRTDYIVVCFTTHDCSRCMRYPVWILCCERPNYDFCISQGRPIVWR